MLNIRNRVIAAVTVAAIALTAVVTPASAGPRRYHRNDAAAAGIMLGIIGAVGAYAAAREYRKAQERRYYDDGYYGRPYGYYGGPRYYGGPYRYGY